MWNLESDNPLFSGRSDHLKWTWLIVVGAVAIQVIKTAICLMQQKTISKTNTSLIL